MVTLYGGHSGALNSRGGGGGVNFSSFPGPRALLLLSVGCGGGRRGRLRRRRRRRLEGGAGGVLAADPGVLGLVDPAALPVVHVVVVAVLARSVAVADPRLAHVLVGVRPERGVLGERRWRRRRGELRPKSVVFSETVHKYSSGQFNEQSGVYPRNYKRCTINAFKVA